MASLVKVSATLILFKLLLGITLLFVSVIRINAVSGIYFLCLLVLPLLQSPSNVAHLRGSPGCFMKAVVILSALGCVTQVLFQVVLAALGTYEEEFTIRDTCNFTDSLWRQLGYERLDDLDALNVARLVGPDVLLLVVSVIVFLSCKYILTPPQTESDPDETGQSLTPVMERRPRKTSVVIEGLRSCNVMLFCALAGIIIPSAISSVYFVTFLIVITWWSFYQTWGRVFKWFEVLWFGFSGCHLIVLFVAQFQFLQEIVPYESDDSGFNITGFVGLTHIVNSLRCDEMLDPRQLSFSSTAVWTTYVNPAFVFLFYWFVGHEVQRWIAGPKWKEYVQVVRRVKKRAKKSAKEEKQGLVSEGAGTSYQTMEVTQQPEATQETDRGGTATGAESGTTSGDERGVHKMSAFTTFIGFLTKQSYIVGLIFMMAWSIIYLSWMTFVLLLWAILIWILPISSTRNRCLYTAPLLVFYAEAIIIASFVYGMDIDLPEAVGDIDLKEVGLNHDTYPFIRLIIEMAFTLMFWLTLRQFLREQKLRKHAVDEGIVLQPFGVIFSGPEEELSWIAIWSSFHNERGGFPSRSHSVTMTFLGKTLNEMLAKYWILLCGLMFLIISLQGEVDIFKVVYMVLFLVFLNIFLVSFTLFRFILRVFCWVVVLYSIGVLCMIYTYQFSAFRYWWTNGTSVTEEELAVLGLRDYDDIGMLVLNLLIPTAFIILVMIQLHYFHHHFITISEIKKTGYRPGRLDEDGGTEGKKEEGPAEGEDVHVVVEETDGASTSSKQHVPSTRSQLKLRAMKAYRYFNKYLEPFQTFLWRMVEIHIMKLIFLAVILVITSDKDQVSAVNGVLLLIIFLPIMFPSLHSLCCLVSMFWVSIVLLGKMIFQLDFTVWFPHEQLTSNCSDTPKFPIEGDFNISNWFGFAQVDEFYLYVQGYVAIIVLLIIQAIVSLHQQQYRYQRGLVKPEYSIVFDDVVRETADQGLWDCLKFFINYFFYKFGLEICFTTTVIVAAVRLDAFAFLFLIMMVPLLFIKRRTCALLWPFYTLTLACLLPVAYALVLGLPPVFCIRYPWDQFPDRLVTWLYLSDYLAAPNAYAIIADFFQLLFVSQQWAVFRAERNVAGTGGDNYEASVDVENVSKNPVPNFTFNRSYLDLLKSLVFGYSFYVTLAIVFLCATTRISLLGLVYLVFAFFFLWYGPKFLTKPTAKVIKQWNLLIGYTIFVIFMKVGLQIMACAYDDKVHDNGFCWIMQLFGVVCLQFDYNEPSPCDLPADQAKLTWDVTCFLFLVLQRQIFTSNYFLYIILDLEDEERLASKGAEMINEILAAKVRNTKLEEQRILEAVKRKMKRIKEKQAKLKNKKNETWHPTTHAEAIRGQGGYYMFEDEGEDELSDLDEEGGTSPKNPLQLAFTGIVEDPKRAIEMDKEHQAALSSPEDGEDVDADAVSYSTAISGDGGDKDKERKPSLEDAAGDDVSLQGSYQDDIEMEQEEEPEGIGGKVKSGLQLTWLIFLRSTDTFIHFLDKISEEYRYVARELKRLTAEGKRKRATKIQQRKAQELADMSGKSEGTADKDQEDVIQTATLESGATGSVEGENGSPSRDVRVTIAPEPTSTLTFERFLVSEQGNDETATETSSGERFQRTMPRPVRLIYAALYAVIAQSQLVCYFIIILNQLLSASVLSLPLVLMVFLWAMLSVPRPTKTFWITVISYTEIVVLLKYLFQFEFYPWNTETERNKHLTDPLWWPRILGVEQKDNYAIIDLCILLAVFFHRSVLIRHGLWQESRVVPNLDEQRPEGVEEGADSGDGEGEQSTDMALRDPQGDQADKGKKKKKKKTKKTKKKKEKKKAEENAGDADGEEYVATSGDDLQIVQRDDLQGSIRSAEDDLSEMEDEPKWYEPLIKFYHNMIDPMYSAVTDVYVFIFGIQFILFLIILFFSSSFGEEQATADVAQLISSNTIPISFLLLLLIMFVLIIIDRAIYLCKDVTAKFVYLVVLVIAVHVWLFFVLPYYNNKPFVDNNPAQVWYFCICIYFGLSAYQITSGYPTRILGNFLCKSYNLVSLVLFYGWRVIPFMTELRTLMDWIWTDTTLSLSHWLQVEDIYANIYPIKCFRNREVAYPIPRGTKTSWIIKYGVGGGMLLGLILIIWFPLILISFSNTTSVSNPPTSVSVEISFGGFEPIFRMSALSEDLSMISDTAYQDIINTYANDLNARSFLDVYRRDDIWIARISGNSTGTWDISPPSRDNLISSLTSDPSLYISFKYSINRVTSNTQVTPTIENTYQLNLTDSVTLRQELIQQLQFTTNDSAFVEDLIPVFLQVPALSSPHPIEVLLERNGYGNASLDLQTGNIPSLEGTKEWWEVSDGSTSESTVIELVTFNERVASELLAPLTSYGIIGLYVSLVLVVGRFVRMYFSGISYQIMFEELPNVDRILRLCLDIYLVRESGEMELEEDLTAKLIFLYRSPETLIKVTKWKTD